MAILRKAIPHRKRQLILIFIEAAIIVLEGIGLYLAFDWGFPAALKYYTNLSNLLFAMGMIIHLAFLIIAFVKGENSPAWCANIKFLGLVHVCMTFLTVLLLLAPLDYLINGNNFFEHFYQSSFLYLHFLCPLLGAIGYFFFEDKTVITWKTVLWSMLFIALYGTAIVIMNGAGLMEAPYPFADVINEPPYVIVISFAVFLAITFGFSALLRFQSNRAKAFIEKLEASSA